MMNGFVKIGLLGMAAALAACSGKKVVEDHEARGHEHREAAAEHEEHGDEEHGHGHGADLDTPVEELFAATCEHGIKTYECDECRYEVGVVRLDPELLKQGLVRTTKVRTVDLDSMIELPAEIRFNEKDLAHVSPRVPGIVRKVHVDLGDRVKKGDPIIEVESTELAEAHSEYLEALAKMRLEKRAFERQQGLAEANVTSERELLEAKQALEAVSIRVDSLAEKLARFGVPKGRIAQMAKAGGGKPSGRVVVRAPLEGDVLDLHAVVGERVDPEKTVAQVGDTSTVWTWVALPESSIGAVRRAKDGGEVKVGVKTRSYPDTVFEGELDFIARAMDARTRTAKARITLKNPRGLLMPGMFAQVELELPGADAHLAVPNSAVLSDEGRNFVFVHHDGPYYVRRPVELGRRGEGLVEIASGLAEGQDVVADGSFLLKSDVLREKMGAGCAD